MAEGYLATTFSFFFITLHYVLIVLLFVSGMCNQNAAEKRVEKVLQIILR